MSMFVTVTDQRAVCREFFAACMQTFTGKEKEYAPEDIPLLDVLGSAVDEEISVLCVLRTLTRKHLTAVRFFERQGFALTESIIDRYRDIANYQALQVFYITWQRDLHIAWAQYWRDEPCHCKGDDVCQMHQTLRWLLDHPPSFAVSRPPSVPSA